jgi:hypothetical protein
VNLIRQQHEAVRGKIDHAANEPIAVDVADLEGAAEVLPGMFALLVHRSP